MTQNASAGMNVKIGYENKLPNLELIRNLYELYYVKTGSDSEQVSSHWKEYSEKIKFSLDETDVPVEVLGYGFGDLQVGSIPYKILSFVAILSYLIGLPNWLNVVRMIPMAWRLTRRMGLSFTQDAFRQLCSLALIERYLSVTQRQKRLQVIVIGDGYGFLASLFKERFPNSTIVLVDLGKVLVFQAYYCQKAHPDKIHQSILEGEEIHLTKSDFVYCPPECLSRVSEVGYDVAANISSMQEMTPESVVAYFEFLRRHMEADRLFYCCNRERKELVGGEIQEFARYPWDSRDVHLVDEGCPWHKYYLSFSTSTNGPRLLGFRVPFVNYFDGPIRHRLTRLSREH